MSLCAHVLVRKRVVWVESEGWWVHSHRPHAQLATPLLVCDALGRPCVEGHSHMHGTGQYPHAGVNHPQKVCAKFDSILQSQFVKPGLPVLACVCHRDLAFWSCLITWTKRVTVFFCLQAFSSFKFFACCWASQTFCYFWPLIDFIAK
jgi:hypothetical protein